MDTRKSLNPDREITECAMGFARRMGLIAGEVDTPEECRVVDSVRRLMAMGLSMEEIQELDIRQPMLQAIFEYAQLDVEDRDQSERAFAAVEATIRVVADEMQKLDLELEMLNMRKRALTRRSQVLRKISFSIQRGDEGLLAA